MDLKLNLKFRLDSRRGVPAGGSVDLHHHHHPRGTFAQEKWLLLPSGRITGMSVTVGAVDPHYHYTVVLRVSDSNYGVIRRELPKGSLRERFDLGIDLVEGQSVCAKLMRGDLGTVSKRPSPFKSIFLELELESFGLMPLVGWEDDPFDLGRRVGL